MKKLIKRMYSGEIGYMSEGGLVMHVSGLLFSLTQSCLSIELILE